MWTMQDNMPSQAVKLLTEQKRRKRWLRAVSLMAAVVVFVTTYALILPAITLEKTPGGGAGVESAADWEATLPTLTQEDDWAENLLRVAKSQLGYQESAANYKGSEDGAKKLGYTRYGAWYGDPYGHWDAMFASFCLHYAEIPLAAFPNAPAATHGRQS